MKPLRTPFAATVLVLALGIAGCSIQQPRYSALWGVAGELWDPAGRLPDYSHAGYRAGEQALPRVPAVADVRDFGATGDGVTDDTAAFEATIESVVTGAILVPPGRYRLTRPITIRRPGVVLRGAGTERSVILADPVRGDCSRPSQGRPNCAPYHSAAVLQISGEVSGRKLVAVIADARRGQHALQVASTADIRDGDFVRLRMHNADDNSLGCHLYLDRGCLNAQRRLWHDGDIVDWVVQVDSASGGLVTLARPLRLDVRGAWSAELWSFDPSVQDSGIEHLTLRFPGDPYAGHNREQGHYGILIRDAYHCWVRDVVIVDADRGIEVRGGHNTVTDVELRAEARRPLITAGVAATGHFGLSVSSPRGQDNLFERTRLQTTFVHNLSVASFASGNVFSRITSVTAHFDHHGGAPYENLYTEIALTGSGADLLLSGGRRADEPGGARSTLWNVAHPDPLAYGAMSPVLPGLNLIGVQGIANQQAKATREDWWFESWPAKATRPANLYEAQRAARIGGARARCQDDCPLRASAPQGAGLPGSAASEAR